MYVFPLEQAGSSRNDCVNRQFPISRFSNVKVVRKHRFCVRKIEGEEGNPLDSGRLKREKEKKRNRWREKERRLRKSAKDNPDGARWLRGNQSGDDSKIVKEEEEARNGRWWRESFESGVPTIFIRRPVPNWTGPWWLLPFANLFIDRTTGRRAF